MFHIVVKQLAHHAAHQDGSAHVLYPGVGGQSGLIGSTALSAGYQPST